MKTSSVTTAALLPLVAALQLVSAEFNCSMPKENRMMRLICGPVVCGSNNITYENDDEFGWAKCEYPDLTVAKRGACPGHKSCMSPYPERGSDAGNSGDGVPSPTKENIVGSEAPTPTKSKSSVAAGIQTSVAIAIVTVGAILAAAA
ncbi:hypothetical protein P43SY_000611 [Pythium insidiosum]|uniref:Kazal-like domain-containing protein n=1 Tax=Pythium insidiosum TaxID=114742 RepID=A0AAD5QAM4_PYTIN|nr:hypothetical protein P43SY_000611 [Pythium insidiosum]